MGLLALLWVILAIVSLELGEARTRVNATEFCVVGAGPAGLQLGRMFYENGMNFVIFERGERAGHFFEKYPINRRLISINKQFTGFENMDINLRHDWNSLLNGTIDPFERGPKPFTKWTKEFFPSADLLVEYLNDYASDFSDFIDFNTNVIEVARAKVDPDAHPGFRLSLSTHEATREHFCRVLIVATGIDVPRKLNITGWELVENYADVSPRGEDFANQRVAILGNGNSAHEISQALHGHTAHNHIFSRNPVKLSFHTHYVGDVRALNLGTLDTYQLKSLDAMIDFGADLEDVLAFVKCQLNTTDNSVDYFQGSQVCMIPQELHGLDETKQKLWLLKHRNSYSLRMPYDRVISAVGWAFNTTIFAPGMKPYMVSSSSGKFPAMRCNFESINVENMYFAGVLMHSRDGKRSAGGFIHGYRYLVRALFKILKRDYVDHPRLLENRQEYRFKYWKQSKQIESLLEGSPVTFEDYQREVSNMSVPKVDAPIRDVAIPTWTGSKVFSLDDLDEFIKHLIYRIHTASGLYQMFGELVDVILLKPLEGRIVYMEEVPRCSCAGPIDRVQQHNWFINTYALHVDEYARVKRAPHTGTDEAETDAMDSHQCRNDNKNECQNHWVNSTDTRDSEEEKKEIRADVHQTAKRILDRVKEFETISAKEKAELADLVQDLERYRWTPTELVEAEDRWVASEIKARMGYDKFEMRECAMCDDRFDKMILSYRYHPKFKGTNTIQRGRVGSQSHKTAEKSNFLHPVVEFIARDANPDDPGLEYSPNDDIHLVEDVQALWDTEIEHLDPLRGFIQRTLLNVSISHMFHGSWSSKTDFLSFIKRGGESKRGGEIKRNLWPGMRVRVTARYGPIRAGDEGIFVTAEPAIPPAVVRFPKYNNFTVPLYFDQLEILGSEEEHDQIIQNQLKALQNIQRKLQAEGTVEINITQPYFFTAHLWSDNNTEEDVDFHSRLNRFSGYLEEGEILIEPGNIGEVLQVTLPSSNESGLFVEEFDHLEIGLKVGFSNITVPGQNGRNTLDDDETRTSSTAAKHVVKIALQDAAIVETAMK